MLTPEQIAALRDAAGQVADPINDYLIADIACRIAGAGQLTSTAAYEVWRAQNLGMSQREVKKQLRKYLGKSGAEIEKLLTQSAEVGYDFDIKRLPQVQAVPFENNTVVQQLVDAAVKLALDDFTNLTQTIGMVDPFGNALPLQEVYRSCTDFAFQQVFTGAADYNTAIRKATKNIADRGIRWIDYESGVHTSLEAAVRRNIMGGMGLMQEQITQVNHDTLGCDGWEISAHAASAPDHEPIQGLQYSDAAYQALNNSLVRRIGTLNCGHVAFPIILGVSGPQYTPEQLQKFKDDNAEGATYQGQHYTMYGATQLQRKVERTIRTQKRRILVDEATGDSEKLTTDRIRLVRLNDEYVRFSKATGLRTQRERAQVVGFGNKQAVRATAGAKAHYREWSKSIGVNDSIETLAKYYDVKYTDSPRYELLEQYANDVNSGWISPLSGFRNYEMLYNRIQTEIVGKSTCNGILITGQSKHFMQRVIGTMVDPAKVKDDLRIIRRSGVGVDDLIDALLNGTARPVIANTRTGKRSQKFAGAKCDVSINPDTGILIQCNPKKEARIVEV